MVSGFRLFIVAKSIIEIFYIAASDIVPQKPVPQPPPTPTPTPKGIGLSDCVKKLIGFFFKTGPGGTEGIDLNSVQLHRDQLPGIPDSYKQDTRAITWGYDVYFNYNELNQNTIDGIVLIVHELTHVQQFKDKGKAKFLSEYGTDYLGNRYGGDPPQ